MSGVIFEGDTTQRFGEKFPKPFIQEIRVFDKRLEADIVLFFRVSLEEDAETFIGNLSDYELYSGFGNKTFRDEINLVNFEIVKQRIFNSEGDRFIKLMLKKIVVFGDEGVFGIDTTISPPSIEMVESAFGAPTDGTGLTTFDVRREVNRRRMQEMASMSGPGAADSSDSDTTTGTGGTGGFGGFDGLSGVSIDGITEGPDVRITSTYFYCCTTIKEEESSEINITQDLTNIDPTGGYNRIANSSSPLVYERVFKPDRTLSIEPVDAYQESDGNIYGQIPLMSLDRRYRKTDNVTHKTIIDNISAVVAPYVGTDITEADSIAVTLKTHKDDPQLLIKLSKQTKNFSNKSSVTPTGQLYANMVDAVVSLDNTLLLEDILEKRRFSNAKIKDRRGDISLVIDQAFTEGLNLFPSYLYKPLISRGTVQTAAGNTIREEDVLESFIISNQSYYFFDYEKCLNYETEISKFFNPYNLLQIFGNNALNKYFKIVNVGLEKSKAHSHRPGSPESVTNLDLIYPTGDGGLLGGSNIASSYSYETTDSANNFLSYTINRRFEGAALDTSIIASTIYSQITERAFDTLDSIDGYRLKCYEIVDLESIEIAERATTYDAKVEIKDTTMVFYKEHLQEPILKMYEDLKRYLYFADDFCSFNNIDGKFNDFFVNQIETEFESPFPWIQGPLLYSSVLAVLQASWEELGSKDVEFETRKKKGSMVDMELIKINAILKSRQISPSTGDLTSLQEFVDDFEKFKNYFEVGVGLDADNEIHETRLGGTVVLKNPSVSKTFERTTQITENINASFDLSPEETETTFSPYLAFMKNSLLDPTIERTQAAMQFYIDTVLEEQDETYAASLDLERLRKKGEGDSYEHRLYFEEGIRWKDMFENYPHLNTLSPRTKEILQIVFPYLRYLQTLPFSSDLSLSDLLPGPLNGE